MLVGRGFVEGRALRGMAKNAGRGFLGGMRASGASDAVYAVGEMGLSWALVFGWAWPRGL